MNLSGWGSCGFLAVFLQAAPATGTPVCGKYGSPVLAGVGALVLMGCFLGSAAVAAEEVSPDLIAAITKGAGENYPVLPALSSEMRMRAWMEMQGSPAIQEAVRKLDPARSNNDWFAAIDSLEQSKALWCLQAALCHPHDDVQVRALRALARLGDKRAVPFLLIYAQYMAVGEAGSESATLHGIIQQEIARTLSSLSRVNVTLRRGQDPEGLKKAILLWTRWYLDQDKRVDD